MSYTFDPLVPRPIDRPTEVATGALTPEASEALDQAKIFSGPADPADRPAWRETLRAWRQPPGWPAPPGRSPSRGRARRTPCPMPPTSSRWPSTCSSRRTRKAS